MALERHQLGLSTDGETYAIPRAGPKILVTLHGGKTSLRKELARQYFTERGRVAPQQALTDAINTLEGIAQQTVPTRLWLRAAQHQGAMWLDIGDATGKAIRIQGGRWSTETPPILFRRTILTSALPTPQPGGHDDELWQWLNVTPEDRPLVLVYLIAALVPDIPHPILALFGEQGTGKTTTMKALVSLLDPSPVPCRKPPRDIESWITAAAGSWMVALDNIREISAWLSDSLCRAVTGEGDIRRKLYTDADLHTFSFRRVLALTGIDPGALNGDLAERLLHITLEPITDTKRRDEAEYWTSFREAKPRLLGSILELAARVLHQQPTVTLERRPRMADFAHILATIDTVLNTQALNRYLGTQERLAVDSLTADPFIVHLIDTITEPFEGTSAELLDKLQPNQDTTRRPTNWPPNARAVTKLLRGQAGALRKAGWHIRDDNAANKQKTLRWTISPPPEPSPNQDPPTPPTPPPRQPQHNTRPDSQATAGHHDPPSTPHPPTTPHTNSLPNGSTGQAGQAGQDPPATLADLGTEMAQLTTELRDLDPVALHTRCDKALALTEGTPDWWAYTARTEPIPITAALELIAQHRRQGCLHGTAHAYLTAAREAHATSSRRPVRPTAHTRNHKRGYP